MFVRVDLEDTKPSIEGFSYENEDGDLEKVVVDGSPAVVVQDNANGSVTIYQTDIPKLIKALQAAYDHIQKGK